uniref:Fatty acyl-CoA reductase C-terminal domain-containing protein n=1 Tax=Timema poppense TaxID=170557 RepID=A0A7R9GU59_TIMPO|nr:unnamed protein product [Timema poppensis]
MAEAIAVVLEKQFKPNEEPQDHDFARDATRTVRVFLEGPNDTRAEVLNFIHEVKSHNSDSVLRQKKSALSLMTYLGVSVKVDIQSQATAESMVRVHDKLQRAVSCLEFFTTHEWRFTNDNMTRLMARLHPRDRKIFNFDIADLDWKVYWEQYVLGTRKFILKEDPSTFPAARSHLRKMYYLHRLSQLVTVFLVWRLLIARSETARYMWQNLVALILKLVKSPQSTLSRPT